jgi:hypothetical protein
MALYGGLSVSLLGGGIPQELDLDTIELFSQFFTLEELITNFRLEDLTVRELTILKAAVLQTIASQMAEAGTPRDAVRVRFQAVWSLLRPPSGA